MEFFMLPWKQFKKLITGPTYKNINLLNESIKKSVNTQKRCDWLEFFIFKSPELKIS